MQIVINFSDIDLADWIEDGLEEEVTLTDVFKGEILNKFVEKINYDYEVKRYIEKNIDDQLWQKIYGYKDDVAIKTIVEKIIEKKLRETGSFIFLNEYAAKVEVVVDKYLKKYPNEIEKAVETSIKHHIESCLKELYKESKMREFIDTEKLSAYIHTVLSEEMVGDT